MVEAWCRVGWSERVSDLVMERRRRPGSRAQEGGRCRVRKGVAAGDAGSRLERRAWLSTVWGSAVQGRASGRVCYGRFRGSGRRPVGRSGAVQGRCRVGCGRVFFFFIWGPGTE